MDEKLRFVFEYERDEQTMAELCARFGICRDTGYVWLRGYRHFGSGRPVATGGLVDQAGVPERIPGRAPGDG